MTRAAIFSSMFVLAACAGARSPTPTNIEVGSSTAPPMTVEDAGGPRPTVTCPIVPIRLVLASPEAPRELTMLTLAPDGAVTSTMLGESAAPMGHLEDSGCLHMKSQVVVDASTPAVVWTPHEEHALDGKRMRLGQRSLEIGADGRITFFDAHGNAENHGTFRIEGFTPAATCAAHAMLVLFFASMPSMAFSDGHPKALPPPAGSKCQRHP